jgi:hypothetical protein
VRSIADAPQALAAALLVHVAQARVQEEDLRSCVQFNPLH